MPNGFLGTRADFLMDIVVVVFAVLPFLELWAISLVRKGEHDRHRRFQVGALVLILVAVVLFEVDIRLSGGTVAFMKDSPLQGTTFLRVFLITHVLIAITTFTAWAVHDVKSWRRQRADVPSLPGDWSAKHRRVGKRIYVGIVLTSITGIALYVMGFVL
jgi:putative membrane protein